MSRDLKRRGFRFVGPTICYSHMQATGMVNDHLVGCFRYREVGRICGRMRGFSAEWSDARGCGGARTGAYSFGA